MWSATEKAMKIWEISFSCSNYTSHKRNMYLVNNADFQDADNVRRAKTPQLRLHVSQIDVLLQQSSRFNRLSETGNSRVKPEGFYTQVSFKNIK